MLVEVCRVGAMISVAIMLTRCAPEGPADRGTPGPVAEAHGPAEDVEGVEEVHGASNVSVEALGSLEKVYVPLSATSMFSLDDALAEKGYGNVTASDLKPRFEHVETEFGPAVVAYSASDWIESESLFQPMSLTQWLEAALADGAAKGVIINPGHPGQTLALTKTQVVEAMTWLPRREALPMEIYVTQ